MQLLKANTAVDVLIGPFLDSTNGNDTEEALTIEDEHVLLSKNGQALTAKTDANDAAHDDLGYYNCPLDTTDTNTEGMLDICCHMSGALTVKCQFMVLAEAAYDSLFTAKDTGYMDVHMKTVEAGIIANASFAADVGSTAHGTNIIALAVRKILEELNLDHLLKVTTGVAADADLEDYVVAGTVLGHLLSTTADATLYKASEDSLQAIKDHIGDGTNLTEAGGDGDHLVEAGGDGDQLTAINLPNQTMDITGNLSGSVGTCTAATVSAIGANVLTAEAINADAITAAKVAADVHTENATACWAKTEAVTGNTNTYGAMIEKVFRFMMNDMIITDATGAVALRNEANDADVAAQTITDNATLTTRTDLVWS